MQLPENAAAFSNLVRKGRHPCFSNLHSIYPIKDRRLFKRLERILSALAYWSPIFCEVSHLPALVFPFVKLVENDLHCFEFTATVLLNWCSEWYEQFPKPPLKILQEIEMLLLHHDKQLHTHLFSCNIPPELYIWSLLQTLLSEVFSKQEWCIIWDHIVMNHQQSYLYFVVLAYLIYFRVSILSCKSISEFEVTFLTFTTLLIFM